MFRRPLVRTVVVAAVIIVSGTAAVRVAVDQQRQDGPRAGFTKVRPERPGNDYRFERVSTPARTVVRDEQGAVVATFTDGARTAAITGPMRTFAEPTRTPAVVTTPVWVRLTPRPWSSGAEKEEWFRSWFTAAVADRSDDALAAATQYLDGAPAAVDENSVRYKGDASFDRADFYDYLGVKWQFPGGATENPAPARYGALDAAGFVRLVYGYRLGYPLQDSAGRGEGLPRNPAWMAASGTVPITVGKTTGWLPLQPGDLVFFDTSRNGVDHVGVYLGLDQSGKPRTVSSRKQAEGPTLTDEGLTIKSARRL